MDGVRLYLDATEEASALPLVYLFMIPYADCDGILGPDQPVKKKEVAFTTHHIDRHTNF